MVSKSFRTVSCIPVALFVISTPLFGECKIPAPLPRPSLAAVTNLQTGLTPIILIHGNAQELTTRCAGWEPFIESALEHPDFFRQFSVYIFLHDTSKPIGLDGNGNAKELGDLINTRFGTSQRIGLVAHSRGGLVARAYMNKYGSRREGERIFSLITLGTPHHGTPVAVPDWGLLTFRQVYKINTACFVNLLYNTTSSTTDICRVRLRFGLAPEIPITYRDTPQFNVNRPGSTDLAWSNFDNPPFGVPSQYEFTLINLTPAIPLSLGNIHTLSTRDANVANPSDDGFADNDLHGMRDAFLDDLNGNERYAMKISAYGGYYGDPNTNTVLLELIGAKVAGSSNKHTDLSWAGRILQAFRSRGASLPLYVANDGLVPIQSALFLKNTKDAIYQYHTDPFFQSRKIVSRPLVIKDLSGMTTTKRIRLFKDFDHLDILEKSFDHVAADLAADLNEAGPSQWTKVSPTNQPPIRFMFAMAYDEARGQVILFGGHTGNAASDEMWIWENRNWRKWQKGLFDRNPPAMWGHSMVYDAVRQKTVVFGGSVLGNNTWLWDGKGWEEVPNTVTLPPSRASQAMTYDWAKGEVVLQGGEAHPSTGYFGWNDTWVWNGSAWVEKLPITSAVPFWRHMSAMAWDPVSRKVVRFGGKSVSCGGGCYTPITHDDTWLWDGSTWQQVTDLPPGGPLPREGHAMAIDPMTNRIILVGGNVLVSTYPHVYEQRSDTWLWNGSTWLLAAPTKPDLRLALSTFAMAPDVRNREVVLFTSPEPAVQETWVWK